jgi:hypothetical protein
MKITVGFSKNNKIFSKIIRWATRSNVSHCYIVINHRSNPEWKLVSHAQGLNVHYVSYQHFAQCNEIIQEIEVPITEELAKKAEELRWTKSGTPYGWLQVLGYVWVLFGKWIGKSWKNPLADGGHTHVCVEWVAVQIGLDHAETMTPEDIRKQLEKSVSVPDTQASGCGCKQCSC